MKYNTTKKPTVLLIVTLLLPLAMLVAENPVALRTTSTATTQPTLSPGVFRRYSPTTEVALPASYPYIAPQKMQYKGALGLDVNVFAKRFAQGEVAYIEITRPATTPAAAEAPVVLFDGKPVRINQCAWGFRGMFPISPTLPAHGWKKITIQYGGKSEDYKLFVQKTNFPVYRSVMRVGNPAGNQPDNSAFIARCQEKKQRVFSHVGPDTFSNRVAFPRDLYRVTSPYYSTRIFERYQIQNGKKITLPATTNYHNGLDLYAKWGDPIFAMADGVAVIAENMFFEGGFIALDHGNGIFTLYMHQSKILIKEGQLVRAGDHIGQAGATGLATGSHLHVSLFLNWIPVDPLGLLSIPIRN